MYYDNEPIKSPSVFPIIIMNDVPNRLIQVNITTSWKNISYLESDYKGWEDLLWFPVPLNKTVGEVTIFTKAENKNAIVHRVDFVMKFANSSSITPILPNEMTVENHLIAHSYDGDIKGKITSTGEIKYTADSTYSDPSSISPCKFEGVVKVDWNKLTTDAKILDVMKYSQIFEYTYYTQICNRKSEIQILRIKDNEFRNQITGGCGKTVTDYFTSEEAYNATRYIIDSYLCKWEQLYGDCLVPMCSSPLLTIVLVVGLILLTVFIIGFIIYVVVMKRMKTNYEVINTNS